MKKLTLLFLLFFVNLYSQEYRYVNAKNGLIVRKHPKKGATRIGKLKHQQKVKINRKTGVKLTVTENGFLIPGEWVEINDLKSGIKGFVFNGFLLPNKYTLKNIDKNTKAKYWKSMSEAKQLPKIKLFLKDRASKKLVTYPIQDFEYFSNSRLTVMKVFEFKNVSHRICVKIEEGGCCWTNRVYNYFVDSTGDLIKLPLLVNHRCECVSYDSYVFPNEKGGKKNRVLLVKYLENGMDCKKVGREILKEYSWNGKGFTLIKEY